MKRIATINGYSLKFHPNQPLAFALPNSSEVSVISAVDWKPVAKLTKLKLPRDLCFVNNAIFVSGFEGHIGVYDQSTFECRSFFKLRKTVNDSRGLYVDSMGERLGLVSSAEGVQWVTVSTQESCFRFRPADDFGFAPHTLFIQAGPKPDQLITLCRHFALRNGQHVSRSSAHVWTVGEDTPIRRLDVLPKLSQKEYANKCQLGLDGALIVSNNQDHRLLGWDLTSGQLLFDNPKLSHGGGGEMLYVVLPRRRLIAVASNGFLDFWNSDMSTVVYQHDTGNREGYYGEMTVSPDERYIACSDGKLSVFELPDSLHGS